GLRADRGHRPGGDRARPGQAGQLRRLRPLGSRQWPGPSRGRPRRRPAGFERDPIGYGPLIVPELAEAAARTGDMALARAALQYLSERPRVRPTDWVLGIEARVRALLSDGDDADGHYRESIERLGRTRVRAELARSHLLYGEWLRRQRRRVDARAQLPAAPD